MLSRTLLALSIAACASLSWSCAKPKDAAKDPIKVAAASDLESAFKEVGEAFEKDTGRKVTFTFGSTGQLSKQIIEGAPFDVFAAANVSFVDEVVTAGQCDKDTQAPYARGRIVVWTKKGSPAPAALSDLEDPKYAKIAIANPEHAPYGKAAKQALEKEQVWKQISSRMVYGENVRQALQFAETGNADVAIVALSIAINNDGGEYFVIDEASHDPLEQALVVCSKGDKSASARDFATFVNSEKGRAIMKRYGFLLPGEKTAIGG